MGSSNITSKTYLKSLTDILSAVSSGDPREWKRYGTRQRKNEALEDLAEAGLLEIVEAAPGKNKKVRLNFTDD